VPERVLGTGTGPGHQGFSSEDDRNPFQITTDRAPSCWAARFGSRGTPENSEPFKAEAQLAGVPSYLELLACAARTTTYVYVPVRATTAGAAMLARRYLVVGMNSVVSIRSKT